MSHILPVLIAVAALTAAAQQPNDSLPWESDTTGDHAVMVEDMGGVTATAPDHSPAPPPPPAERPPSGLGWLVMACGAATLLGVGGCVAVWLTRREALERHQALAQALEQAQADRQLLADNTEQELAALRAQVAQLARIATAPTVATRQPREAAADRDTGPQTLYLSKADASGAFARASARFELGNSLFVLTTTDGRHGTFTVIDNADAQRFALMMPTDNLATACHGEAIQLSAGKTAIVTDQPGKATLDGGCWRVTQKAIIHYT